MSSSDRRASSTLYEQGKIQSAEVDQLSPNEVIASGAKTGPLEWGCNSRGRAVHAHKVLGWKPSRGSLDVIAEGSEEWGMGLPLRVGREELEYRLWSKRSYANKLSRKLALRSYGYGMMVTGRENSSLFFLFSFSFSSLTV